MSVECTGLAEEWVLIREEGIVGIQAGREGVKEEGGREEMWE